MQSRTISLFKYLPGPGGVSGTWELYAANVTPSFYNVNEDARSAKAEWYVEAGELEAKVTPHSELSRTVNTQNTFCQSTYPYF